MPRETRKDNRIELPLYDPLTGDTSTVYYRTPTNAERIQFEAACVKGKGKKSRYEPAEAQIVFGARLCTGIKDGDFTHEGKPISSDKDSGHYFPEWLDLMKETCGDLLKGISAHAFRTTVVETEEEDTGEPSHDLPGMEGLDGKDESAGESAKEGVVDSPLV